MNASAFRRHFSAGFGSDGCGTITALQALIPEMYAKGARSMTDERNPHSPGPTPIEPKKPLPGQDANFPGQPPIVDLEKRGHGGPTRQQPDRRPRSEDKTNDSPADDSLERRESDHVESPGHVERELPTSVGGEREKGEWPNEGEGNKTADREYRKGTEAFVKSGRVEEQAQKAAEALDSDEGKELRQAEQKGRQGRPKTR
jgi:hypothetical protein